MGGVAAHEPVMHTEPVQQSALAVHAPPCATHGPTAVGTAAQWRVGGSVSGVSRRQTEVFGLTPPPQQSSSTSHAFPVLLQPSKTQKPRSFTYPLAALLA